MITVTKEEVHQLVAECFSYWKVEDECDCLFNPHLYWFYLGSEESFKRFPLVLRLSFTSITLFIQPPTELQNESHPSVVLQSVYIYTNENSIEDRELLKNTLWDMYSDFKRTMESTVYSLFEAVIYSP